MLSQNFPTVSQNTVETRLLHHQNILKLWFTTTSVLR